MEQHVLKNPIIIANESATPNKQLQQPQSNVSFAFSHSLQPFPPTRFFHTPNTSQANRNMTNSIDDIHYNAIESMRNRAKSVLENCKKR